MNPDDLIVRTPRSRLGWLIDAVLTALAWVAFVWLCVSGLLAIFREANAGPAVPGWGALMPTMGTLTLYVVVGMINGVILLAWARYNQYRFAGLQRRAAVPPLANEELAQSFGLPVQRLAALHQAKIAVVEHEPDGAIANVRLR